MTLRYDFDPEPHRSRLREAMAELQRHNRRPRREPRVPLALRTDATALLRGLSATVSNASRAGARLELVGPRLPVVAAGDRLVMTLAGSRTGSRRPRASCSRRCGWGRSGGPAATRRQEVGGRFLRLSPTLRAAHPGHPPLRRCAAGAPPDVRREAPRAHPATVTRSSPP